MCSDWLSWQQEPSQGPKGWGPIINSLWSNNWIESVGRTFLLVKAILVPRRRR